METALFDKDRSQRRKVTFWLGGEEVSSDPSFTPANAPTELKIRKLILPNQVTPIARIEAYFDTNGMIPDWFRHLAHMTEKASKPHDVYENPNAASLSVLRSEFVGYMDHFYRDDHVLNCFTWCPIGIQNHLSAYSVYYATVNFIDYVEQLVKRFPGLPMDIVKALRELQDRFQLLSLYMERMGYYKDQQLLGETIAQDELVLTPLEVYGPRSQIGFGCSELPDLITHTAFCKFCGNSDEYPFQEEWHDFIIRRLNKALPFACKSRSVTDILTYSWSSLIDPTSPEGEKKKKKEKKSNKRQKTSTTTRTTRKPRETTVKPKKTRKQRNCQPARTKRLRPSITYNRGSTSNRKKERFEDILEIVKRMVVASLLGIYDHCQQVPGFDVRRKVYNHFFLNDMRRDLFDKWIKDNSRLVTYIIREFLYFCVAALPGLEGYLRENYYWGILVDNAFGAMDDARKFMDTSLVKYLQCEDRTVVADTQRTTMFDVYDSEHWHGNVLWPKTQLSLDLTDAYVPLKPWHRELFALFSRYNKENLERAPRTMEINFIDKVFNVTYAMNDEKFSRELMRLDEIVPKEIQDTIAALIDTMYQNDTLSQLTFASLACSPVNLSGYAISELERGRINYEMEESRSKIKNIMENIHARSPYDYFVLYLFFYHWKDKCAITIVNTSADMQRTLLATLHRLYETKEGEKLPDSAGLYYYCPSCKQIKTNVFEWGTVRDKYRYSSLCSVGICVDVVTGRKTCAKLSSKNNPKHRDVGTGLGRDGLDSEKKRKKSEKNSFRQQQKNNKNAECPNTTLVEVNMRDKMLVTSTGIFLLCPLCATMTRLCKQNRMNKEGVFSCGCVNYDQTLVDMTSMCEVCGKTCKNPLYIEVYDDVVDPHHIVKAPDRFPPYDPTQKHTIRRIPVCNSHGLSWVERDPQLLPLSFVRFAVAENFTSYTKNKETGERIYVGLKNNRGSAAEWDRVIRSRNRKIYTGEKNIQFESLESMYDRVAARSISKRVVKS